MSVPPPTQPSLDSVSTIRDDGSRRYLFPADVSGRFTRARAWAALVLIAIYLLLPWIKVGGYPAVFLDVAERRFHFFGLTLAAQDLWLMFFLITGLGFRCSSSRRCLGASGAAGPARRPCFSITSTARSSAGSKAMPWRAARSMPRRGRRQRSAGAWPSMRSTSSSRRRSPICSWRTSSRSRRSGT